MANIDLCYSGQQQQVLSEETSAIERRQKQAERSKPIIDVLLNKEFKEKIALVGKCAVDSEIQIAGFVVYQNGGFKCSEVALLTQANDPFNQEFSPWDERANLSDFLAQIMTENADTKEPKPRSDIFMHICSHQPGQQHVGGLNIGNASNPSGEEIKNHEYLGTYSPGCTGVVVTRDGHNNNLVLFRRDPDSEYRTLPTEIFGRQAMINPDIIRMVMRSSGISVGHARLNGCPPEYAKEARRAATALTARIAA